ncbi:unnamed protein product [Ostreobium quekettii]|uniref:AB hydrolase-1 domain-containing protein n=1 Tax=Ostreobium quekettii TaxID=121088 RepID=A0A8S1IKS6_9CHLO|nr:unnamed protein product [Ostreobium quekettii]CAD7698996.1 unnamed protein product [Ostreobium quekettii]|eukprot:evm.model.scf_180.8 EVM.evm.TU.scf_180.8   scf_180:88687-90976(-)
MTPKAPASKEAAPPLAPKAPRLPSALNRLWAIPCRRRETRLAAIAAPPDADLAAAAPIAPKLEIDARGAERVAWRESGWNYWDWDGKRVHYISAGDKGSPVVLIHGFGASAYHYRYNIPELAKRHRVFAVDLLGFGLSEKVVTDYSGARLWTDEIAAFLREFVGEPAVLVGNSLGGYVAFAAAARHPELVRGVVGINAAGFFEDAENSKVENNKVGGWIGEVRDYLADAFRKGALTFAFYRAKRPGRIRQVLETVYLSKANLDEDLVRSIALPAEDPAAAEVFARVVNTTAFQERVSLDSLFAQMDTPMLLLWGDKDPWMTPAKADKMLQLYPRGIKIGVDAGHCPHDEAPEAVNEALIGWLNKVDRL